MKELLLNDSSYHDQEANGSGVVWAVLNPAYTLLAIAPLAPGVDSSRRGGNSSASMQT